MGSPQTYWKLMKSRKPLTSLAQLGTIAAKHETEIAHELARAVAVAVYNGSNYGWEKEA